VYNTRFRAQWGPARPGNTPNVYMDEEEEKGWYDDPLIVSLLAVGAIITAVGAIAGALKWFGMSLLGLCRGAGMSQSG